MEQLSRVPDYVGRLLDLPVRVDSLRKAGLLDPMRPDEALRSLIAVRQFGPLAGAAHIAAQRDGHALALVDELGPLTFDQLDRRSNALARAWAARGVRPDSVIAVLARDHRGLVDCMLGAAKIGARLLLMNTGFSKPQLTDVVQREGVAALAFDQEFSDLLGDVPTDVPRYLCWLDDPDTVADDLPKLDELIASTTDAPVPTPPKPGGLVLLTSGTTGTPKGAPRHVTGVLGATHFVERIPLRIGGGTFIASPMFHATGLSQLILSLALGSTIVARRRFDAEATLREIAENHCTGAVLVPTQLARILDLGDEVLARYDTSSLRTIITAGSLLPPDVSNRALHAFGPVLYNLYGSTEVAVASIATPEELLAAPGTVGRPPRGCVVRLYDKQGNRVTGADVKGRIFVGSELAFGGYTGGGHKEIIDGLLSSGDVGHFDASGLLFVDGRDDDMIVSGGENVYPAEIENLLLERTDIADAVVIGVEDADFGQRLRAFVVAAQGMTLVEAEIKAHVRANLARYKVPREVIFLEELPRNPTGKVLRRKLAEYEYDPES
ncbi:MAG TPA: acyl-CoA synthetase [Pseudonocardiaceae bacterium]|nr:acyl-CoA synthetase [Pseudonocardiaceae bacterium]